MKAPKVIGFVAFALFSFASAAAADNNTLNRLFNHENSTNVLCVRFNFNPRACDRIPGCRYDFHSHRCERIEFNRCKEFSFDPQKCVERGCDFDWHYYKCVKA